MGEGGLIVRPARLGFQPLPVRTARAGHRAPAGHAPMRTGGGRPGGAGGILRPFLGLAEILQIDPSPHKDHLFNFLLSEPAVADPRFIGPIDRHIVNNSHIFSEIFQKYL